MGRKQETIADIIAEKRRRADEIERDCAEKMKRGEMISDCYARELVADIRREADRLEAAHGRELSKNASKNGGDFGQFDAEALRDALKDIEATVTAALAHQPEDEAKCGQFLYDAPVKCFNIADLACHAARTENGAAVSREAATAENSSAVGNAAKLREAVVLALSLLDLKEGVPYKTISQKDIDFIKAALARPPRNCDVGTAMEQGERFSAYCRAHKHPESECLTCPIIGETCGYCELAWAQMPYEEGGEK